MKTFQVITLLALVAASMAFSPNQIPQSEYLNMCCVESFSGGLVIWVRRINRRLGQRKCFFGVRGGFLILALMHDLFFSMVNFHAINPH